MIKRIFNALASAARLLLRDWRALIILSLLYLATLGAIYIFLVTREATVGQLSLSLLLALAAPVLFLIIQTMAARYDSRGEPAWRLFMGSLRDFWKLLVIAIPLILIAVLAIYLFGKFDKSAPVAAVREAARSVPAASRRVAPKPQPVSWQTVAATTLEYLLFCLVLPLAAIYLWTQTARDGLTQTFRQSPRILARAFTPQSVLAYAIGFVFFAVIPYFLIVPTTHLANPWLEAGLLVMRLLVAALFSLIGWVVTVGALGNLKTSNDSEHIAQPGEANVPAEA
jgi:hypothetical protein